MDLSDNSIQSFVIKIWLEETVAESGRATWRGHITHVASGDRRYLQSLADIPALIAPYLQAMGITVDVEDELRQWLQQRPTR